MRNVFYWCTYGKIHIYKLNLLDAENINEQSDKNTTANMECESFAEFKGAGDELHYHCGIGVNRAIF